MQVSKSEYMMFLRHPIYLWLKKYNKQKLPQIDAALQAVFDAGHYFESFAEKLFLNANKLGFNTYDEYLSLTSRTKTCIEEIIADKNRNDDKTLLQARFESEINGLSVTCICDAVVFKSNKSIDLYEIKAGTRVKQDNLYDLAFQVCVLEAAGYKVKNIYVINTNGQYVRQGDIDVNQLCVTTKVTKEVRDLVEFTREKISEIKELIALKVMPELTAPSEDDDVDYLNSWLELYSIFNTLEEGTIFDLCWPKNRVAQLHALGIKNLIDIDEDFDLTPKQLAQVKAAKSGKEIIEKDKIKEFLNEFQYPLYFLDYETSMDVIPPFDGTSPYQQIPFQYSLHVIDSEDGELQHMMYLHKENTDPVVDLAKHLSQNIGDGGTILTWNANFEKGCNLKMGLMHPEYEDFFDKVNERIMDLATPFQQCWYVDHRFLGSYSIKKVLPVVVPDLSYKDLGINEGLSAQRKWMQAIIENKFSEEEKLQILRDLEIYCELDTFAMVEIYRFLKSIID